MWEPPALSNFHKQQIDAVVSQVIANLITTAFAKERAGQTNQCHCAWGWNKKVER